MTGRPQQTEAETEADPRQHGEQRDEPREKLRIAEPDRQTSRRDGEGPAGHEQRAGGEQEHEYRIEDLAHHSGTTVRTIRAYQDRGLLPRPVRRGRANVYGDLHLARLGQIAELLERGYTLASIKDLLEAWDQGRGLGGVLGLVTEVEGPWTDEQPGRLTREQLDSLFGRTDGDSAIAEAVSLGVLEPLPDTPEQYLVPSPQELAVAAELHSAGVPLSAITEQLRELRSQMEHIAARFVDFTNEHVFARYLGRPSTDEDATEAADLVRRLRPLAQQTVDAELARAMRTLAARNLRHHLRTAAGAGAVTNAASREEGDGKGKDPTGEAATARWEAEVTTARDATEGALDTPDAAHGAIPGGSLDMSDAVVAGSASGSASGRASGSSSDSSSGSSSAFGRTVGAGTGAGYSGVFEVPGELDRGGGGGSDRDGRVARGAESIALGAGTLNRIRALVGEENTAAFITAAAEREVQARVMDRFASRHGTGAAKS